jgi:putative acetyltransferase
MDVKHLKTNAANADFQAIIAQLDAYLAILNGDKNDFYKSYNSIEPLQNVIVTYLDTKPIGCGAFKPIDTQTAEIKRMFVYENVRGKGIASVILSELEIWAKELGYKKCVLETGIFMPDAIALYQKNGYQKMANYGQYKNVDSSICFEKYL